MTEFKTQQGIRAGYDDLPLQAITVENTVTLPDGTRVSLDDMTPRSYFTETANCFQDSQPAACPEPTVMTKTDAATGLQVFASMDGSNNGEITSLIIGEKGSGKHVTLVAVAPGIVTYIPFEAFDREFYNSFEYGNPRQVNIDMEQKQEEEQQQPSRDHDENDSHDLGGFTCNEFREIELAVVLESTFFLQAGGKLFVEAAINNIMCNVANTYEVDGLCYETKISHYEQYCDLATDPYQEGFLTNSAGCGKTGVLQAFEDYWNDNRQDVQRDAAMLFSGRCLQFSLNGCSVIGCAYLGVSCVARGKSYEVSQVGYTYNPLFRAYLVSHELGHILGANHDDIIPWNIMRSSGNTSIRFFSQGSKNSFLDARNDACITTASSDGR